MRISPTRTQKAHFRQKWAFGVRAQEMGKNGLGAMQPPLAAQHNHNVGAGRAVPPTDARSVAANGLPKPRGRRSQEAAAAEAQTLEPYSPQAGLKA